MAFPPFQSLATAGVYSQTICCTRPAAVTITSGEEGRQLLGEGRGLSSALCSRHSFLLLCVFGGALGFSQSYMCRGRGLHGLGTGKYTVVGSGLVLEISHCWYSLDCYTSSATKFSNNFVAHSMSIVVMKYLPEIFVLSVFQKVWLHQKETNKWKIFCFGIMLIRAGIYIFFHFTGHSTKQVCYILIDYLYIFGTNVAFF